MKVRARRPGLASRTDATFGTWLERSEKKIRLGISPAGRTTAPAAASAGCDPHPELQVDIPASWLLLEVEKGTSSGEQVEAEHGESKSPKAGAEIKTADLSPRQHLEALDAEKGFHGATPRKTSLDRPNKGILKKSADNVMGPHAAEAASAAAEQGSLSGLMAESKSSGSVHSAKIPSARRTSFAKMAFKMFSSSDGPALDSGESDSAASGAPQPPGSYEAVWSNPESRPRGRARGSLDISNSGGHSLTLREQERKARCRALKAAAERPSCNGKPGGEDSDAAVRLSPHAEKRVQFDLSREAQLTKLRARGTFSLLYQVRVTVIGRV